MVASRCTREGNWALREPEDHKRFKMLNQCAVDIPTLPVQPVSFRPHPVLGGMLSRREGPPSIWDTHGKSGNVFANPAASSSAHSPQELNPWISHISEHIQSSPAGKSENQTPVQDHRCQFGPLAENSFIFSGGDSSKIYGHTNNDCRSQIFISTNSHTSNIFLLEDKIQDRGMYLFTISYGRYAMDQRSGNG